MRTLKFFAGIALLSVLFASCVEKSEQYQSAIAERDSLQRAKTYLDSTYSQTLQLLNDIETGFSKITEDEKNVRVNLTGTEGKLDQRREHISNQMLKIKASIDENKAKIARLKSLSAKQTKQNKLLDETISRLQSELVEKESQIQSLIAELQDKNIKIEELNKNIADQNTVIADQKSTIQTQDTHMNEVWYCVATSKQLTEMQLVSKGGLFQPKKLLASNFDHNQFVKEDLRKLSVITTNSKKAKLLSLHPVDSYKVNTGADKLISIEITNPGKFWSTTKYLVVQI